MRIALLTTDSREHFNQYDRFEPYFGAAPEALLQGLAARDDVEVHVVSCLRQPVRSPEKLAGNIWYHGLHVPKLGWLRTGYQGCIRAVRRKLREIRPDLVHGQGTERDCAVCAVFSGYPRVLTIHGNMAEMARVLRARFGSYAWFAAWLEDFALARSAGVLCNSKFTEELVRPRARRTWRVPNSLRPEFFREAQPKPAQGKCVLLNVGVVTENKQQLKLLDVAQRLHAQKLNFEFRFVGSAEPSYPYARLFLERIKSAEREGYARHEEFKFTDALVECFDQADALVHFPKSEAFGLVFAEALARNLHCFGARLGGLVDISEGVEGAELIGPDDWDGLGQAIAAWMRQGNRKPRLAAPLMRQRYHPEVIARRHLEIYREVLSTVS